MSEAKIVEAKIVVLFYGTIFLIMLWASYKIWRNNHK